MIVRELITRLGFGTDLSGARQYDQALDRVEQKARKTSDALKRTMAGIWAFSEITEAFGQIGRMIEAVTMAVPRAGAAMQASLSTINGVLEDTAKSAEVYEQLYQAVRRTGGTMEDTAKAFSRFQLAMADNNRTAEETVELVGGLQAAMTAAGLSATETASITTQLGQALASGTLSGDEFKSLRENLPQLANFLRNELGKSGAEFKKMAEDQKLTADILIDPLLKFARLSTENLRNLPLDMNREWSGFVVTFQRFLAEIDKAFGIQARLAAAIRWVSDTLERWRSKIPMVAELIGGFQGLASAARVAGIALALAFSPAILAIMTAVTRRLVTMVAPLLLVAAVIEDLFVWMTGGQSVAGRLFGPFDEVLIGITAKIEELKAQWRDLFSMPEGGEGAFLSFGEGAFTTIRDAFKGMEADGRAFGAWLETNLPATFRAMSADGAGAWAAVTEAWRLFKADIEPAKAFIEGIFTEGRDKAVALGTAVSDLASVVRTLLVSAFGEVGAAVDRMFAGARSALDWIDKQLNKLRSNTDALRNGPATQGDPATGMMWPGSFGAPAITPNQMVSPAAAMIQGGPQSVTMQNNVTVNATGASAAEVAAGASKGTQSGGQRMLDSLTMAARDLGVAMPRAEFAAG